MSSTYCVRLRGTYGHRGKKKTNKKPANVFTADYRFSGRLFPNGKNAFLVLIYSDTVKTVLSVLHIKRTPSIKWTPKFSPHMKCKINLHSADTSVKRTRTRTRTPTTKPAISGHFKDFLLLNGSAQTALTLFSDVSLNLK